MGKCVKNTYKTLNSFNRRMLFLKRRSKNLKKRTRSSDLTFMASNPLRRVRIKILAKTPDLDPKNLDLPRVIKAPPVRDLIGLIEQPSSNWTHVLTVMEEIS